MALAVTRLNDFTTPPHLPTVVRLGEHGDSAHHKRLRQTDSSFRFAGFADIYYVHSAFTTYLRYTG